MDGSYFLIMILLGSLIIFEDQLLQSFIQYFKSKNVYSRNFSYHDSAACLIKDGEILSPRKKSVFQE